MNKIINWFKEIFVGQKSKSSDNSGIVAYIVNGKKLTKEEFDKYKQSLKGNVFK